MVTLHVPPTVLWRESSAYCECACESSQWTLRLCVGSVTVEERVSDRITPLLPIAQQWRENVTRVLEDKEPARPKDDRRRAMHDRRAVRRAGRRGEEPYGSDRHAVALLAEVARLREENMLLRHAALTFGALAERLNKKIRSGTL